MSTDGTSAEQEPTGRVWTGRCAARAGIAGNPSDALGGAAVAVPVGALSARVELRPSRRLRIRAVGEPEGWGSVAELVTHARRFGHEGGNRLVSAAVVTLARSVEPDAVDLGGDAFDLRWSTDIPRSVGLAGSSALVIATMRALVDRWELDVSDEVIAALALDAEAVELGVAAGWMDRATQASDAITFVDTRRTIAASGREVPVQRRVEPGAPVELVVAWDPAGAAPSGRLHGGLRERVAAQEPAVLSAVAALVVAAEDAVVALESGDRAALADAAERTCALRADLGALDAHTAALVEMARRKGASATSAGSGGAVLAVPRGDASELVAHYVDEGRPALRLALG